MKTSIAGAGAIGMGYAAYLQQRGHCPLLWSPSGQRTYFLSNNATNLIVTGAIETSLKPDVAITAEELAQNDVIIVAVPAFGYRTVLEQLIPFLEARHCVIMSGHLSFAALFLSKKLAERGLQIPIAVWNTTALTSKAPIAFDRVRVGKIRKKIEMVVIPHKFTVQATDICNDLFGDVFIAIDDLITNTLGNINPIYHLAVALCNLTRIEKGEEWFQNTNTTTSVNNLIEELDRERLKIAGGYGKSIDSMKAICEQMFKVSGLSMTELTALEITEGIDPPGPKSIDTRYVLEDVPYGIVPAMLLSDMVSEDLPLHKSGLKILNACYLRDFTKENNIISELGPLTKERLVNLSIDGFWL